MKKCLSCAGAVSHACGVFGIFGADNAAEACYLALYALQHRGQQGAGIAVSHDQGINLVKDVGLLNDVFSNPSVFEALSDSSSGIGHVRCSVEDTPVRCEMQPFVVNHRTGQIAVSHNGRLSNLTELQNELEDAGAIFQTNIDAEAIAYIIARNMGLSGDISKAVEDTTKRLKGAFALTILTHTSVIGVRDPYGISPLCIGEMNNGAYCIASESCAFEAIGAKFLRDVEPGEIVVIDELGMHSRKVHGPGNGLCSFEYVYFARADSVIDGVNVHHARKNMGRALSKVMPVEADMVIGVPDSANPAALGYAAESGIEYGIGLCKNRYIGRAMTDSNKTIRSRNVGIKLNAMRASVAGKRIVLVDDSIVHGDTSAHIVGMLKRMGATQVHVRISSPPVVQSCPYGVDTHDRKHLISAKYDTESIKNYIHADSLAFLSVDELIESIDDSKTKSYCTGCFNGCYPERLG